jgi:ATP synthase protein I
MNEDRDSQAFEQRLAAAQETASGKAKPDGAHASASSAGQAINLAMRLGVEMVAAMVIAVVIGWGLDRLFHTSPWLMIVMVPVGMVAGLRNLLRAADGRTDR